MTGLHLERKQHDSMVWWDVIHTASNLQVDTATTQFFRKRDAQSAMDRLLAAGVDWTLDSKQSIAASNPSAAAKVEHLIRAIRQERQP